MNLIPPGEPGRRLPSGRPGLPSAPGLLAGVILAILVAGALLLEARILAVRGSAEEAERDSLAREIEERRVAAARLEREREELADIRRAERRLLRWDEERGLLPELLRGLARRVSEEAVFEELRRDEDRFWITGRIASGVALSEATAGLAEADRVETLELLWVQRAEGDLGGGHQRFALTGRLRFNTPTPERFVVVEPLHPDPGGGS